MLFSQTVVLIMEARSATVEIAVPSMDTVVQPTIIA
jgi:hypothetical protein